MHKGIKKDSNYINIILLVCLIFVVTELLLMFIIDKFQINFCSFFHEGLFDATGLILITTPLIYYLTITRIYSGKNIGNLLLYMIGKYSLMVFVIEFSLMSLLGLFTFSNPYYDNLLDASFGGLISLPILYYWVVPSFKRTADLPPPSFGKIFFFLCLLSLIFATALCYSLYHTNVVNKTILLESNERAQLEKINTHIMTELQSVFADLAFLTNQSEFLEMLDGEEGAITLLENDYISFLKNKGHFDRIRFIDDHGMEVIRVIYNAGKPITTAGKDLQSKAKRYYFQETMALSSGDIFVSPLDLSLEKGEVEMPFKPMIRFGTPIFDAQQRKRGVLVLNVYGNVILDHLDRFADNLSGDLLLLNDQGEYLFAIRNLGVWSFMFPDKPQYHFQDQFTASWDRISQEVEGQFRNNRVLFTFMTPQRSEDMQGYKLLREDEKIKWTNWKLVSVFGREKENEVFAGLRSSMIMFNSVFSFFVIVGCGVVAKVVLFHFQAKHRRYKEHQRQDMLLALNDTNEINLSEMASYVTNDAMVITNSKDGFFANVEEDCQLTVLANIKRAVVGSDMRDTPLFQHIEKSILMEVIQAKECRIINDYSSLQLKKKAVGTGNRRMKNIRLLLAPLFDDTRVVGIVGVANKANSYDLSDKQQLALFLEGSMVVLNRRSAQRQINFAKKEAEIANVAKSDFLRNVGHELRTPLNTISGMNYMLEQSGLSVKQKEYIRQMKEATKGLLTIIKTILDYSKANKGALKVSSSDTFNIHTLINTLVEQVRSEVNSCHKNIFIEVGVHHKVPVELIGDPVRVRQVLQYLTENAVKFTDRGRIVIAIKLIQKKKERVWLRFSVKDSGIGLGAEQINTLFHSFSQVDAGLSRKFGGLGLGLSVSKRLVQLMGGEMAVESELGKGSTFFFWLEFGVDKRVTWVPEVDKDANRSIAWGKGHESPKGLIVQGLWPKLHDFVALCAVNDLAACQLFSEISGEMQDIYPEQTRIIAEDIERYDFEAASSKASKILLTPPQKKSLER